MKDGILVVCPKCAGLIFVPSSLKGVDVLELLRQRRAQREGGMEVSDGSENQEALSQTPSASARSA